MLAFSAMLISIDSKAHISHVIVAAPIHGNQKYYLSLNARVPMRKSTAPWPKGCATLPWQCPNAGSAWIHLSGVPTKELVLRLQAPPSL